MRTATEEPIKGERATWVSPQVLWHFANYSSSVEKNSPLPNPNPNPNPKNTTPYLQPLDQGIIRSFKASYRRHYAEYLVSYLDSNNSVPPEIDILQAIHLIATSWSDVPPKVIFNCWQV